MTTITISAIGTAQDPLADASSASISGASGVAQLETQLDELAASSS